MVKMMCSTLLSDPAVEGGGGGGRDGPPWVGGGVAFCALPPHPVTNAPVAPPTTFKKSRRLNMRAQVPEFRKVRPRGESAERQPASSLARATEGRPGGAGLLELDVSSGAGAAPPPRGTLNG